MRELAELKNITKCYGNNKALDNVNFTIRENSLLGLIGPNGSGKTTMLSILCGLITVMDGGELIKDKNIKIGALIEKPIFYSHLSASQNLTLIAKIKEIKDFNVDILLEQVGLQQNKDKRYSQFSLGMRQRLGIAAALIDNPDIILLDEPTNGLDPYGIRDIKEIIFSLHQAGKTLIVSSHVLSEIEQICTEIVLLDNGCIKFFGSKEEFLEKSANVIAVYSKDVNQLNESICNLDEIENTKVSANSIIISFKTQMTVESTKKFFILNGIDPENFVIKENKMENALFNLTV